MEPSRKNVLLIIDIQHDFLPGGSLQVSEGDKVIPVLQSVLEKYHFDQIILSQDYHPEDHMSFAENNPGSAPFNMKAFTGTDGKKFDQMMWPVHCVEGTHGADFHPNVLRALEGFGFQIVQKGRNQHIDSYSVFKENDHKTKTRIYDVLKGKGIHPGDDSVNFFVLGLALDYCVAYSALDAKADWPGANVLVIEDGCRGVAPETINTMKEKMRAQGVQLIQSESLSFILRDPVHLSVPMLVSDDDPLPGPSSAGSHDSMPPRPLVGNYVSGSSITGTSRSTTTSTSSSSGRSSAARPSPKVLVWSGGATYESMDFCKSLGKFLQRSTRTPSSPEKVDHEIVHWDRIVPAHPPTIDARALVIVVHDLSKQMDYDTLITQMRLEGKPIVIVRLNGNIQFSQKMLALLMNIPIIDAFAEEADGISQEQAQHNAINMIGRALFTLLYPNKETRRNPKPGPFGTEKVDTDRFFREMHLYLGSHMAIFYPKETLFSQANDQVMHMMSRQHPVTLGAQARKAAGIPEEATHFAWLFQVVVTEEEQGQVFRQRQLSDVEQAYQNMFKYGSYVYFQKQGSEDNVLRVNAICPGPGLFFVPTPLRFHYQTGNPAANLKATGDKEIFAYMQEGLFNPVTIDSMLENTDVEKYTWIPPCAFSPHGGFAYLHKDGVIELWNIANPKEIETRIQRFVTFERRRVKRLQAKQMETAAAVEAAAAAGDGAGPARRLEVKAVALEECSVCLDSIADTLFISATGEVCHCVCSGCAKGYVPWTENHKWQDKAHQDAYRRGRAYQADTCARCVCLFCRNKFTKTLRLETFPTPGGLCASCHKQPIEVAVLHKDVGHLVLCKQCRFRGSCPFPNCRAKLKGTQGVSGLHSQEEE